MSEELIDPNKQDEEGIIVAIGMPSHDLMHASTAGDLARMVAYTAANFVTTVEAREAGFQGGIRALLINQVSATLIDQARQELAEGARAQNADYVLFVDSDMRFPRDALVRLLMHEEPIVGVNYSNRKTHSTDFVAAKTLPYVTDDGKRVVGKRLRTMSDSTGLEEVEATGFGLMLIHMDVFEALPDPNDENGWWFKFEWDSGLGKRVGEDVYFCGLARDAGFKVYVDQDLSKEIKHSGVIELTAGHVEARYEMMEEMDGADHELLEPSD